MSVMANVSHDGHTRKGHRVMGQPVAFFEIISPNAERARKFYAELFGRIAVCTDPDGNQVGLWA